MPKWMTGQLLKRIRNRRRAPRLKAPLEARLLAGVSVPTGNLNPNDQGLRALVGITRDLSETGLSIVLPSIEIGGEFINDEGHQLRVVLSVPGTGGVIMRTSIVRWEQLEGKGHLLGMQITKMSDFDQKRYFDYLRTMS